MKKLKLFITLLLVSITLSCNKDDDNIEIIDYTIGDFFVDATTSSNGSEVIVTVQVTTDSPFEELGVSFQHSSGQTPGGTGVLTLLPTTGGWGREFVFHANHTENGILTITLLGKGKNESTYRTESLGQATVSIEFIYHPVVGDASVHFVPNLVQTSLPGEEFSGQLLFNQNSLNEGQLIAQMYEQGTPIGDQRWLTLIGQNGNLTISQTGLQEGNTYQIVIKNTDMENPSYHFLDETGQQIIGSNGYPVSSIIIEFTVLSMESITMLNHSIFNITTMGCSTSGEVQKNFENIRRVYVKVYNSNNEEVAGSYFDTQPGYQNDTFELSFNGLMENTNYTVRYFLENNPTHFFEAGFVTEIDTSSFVFNFLEAINVTPLGFTVPYVATNTSQQDRQVTLKFMSNGIEQTSLITIPGNSTQYLSEVLTTNWYQLSVVNYSAHLNGNVIAEGNQQTDAITYSNIQNLNGDGGSSQQIINQNQTLNFSDFRFHSNGKGYLNELSFVFENQNDMLPWDYLLIIGINGNNISVTNPSVWENLGNGKYKVTLMNLSIEVVEGINALPLMLSSGSYSETGNFDYQTIAQDTHGQEFGETTSALELQFNQ